MDAADLLPPLIEHAHVAERVGPAHGRGDGLAAIEIGGDGVGLTDSGAGDVCRVLRLSQVRLSRVDRVSFERGGKGQHALLAYRARLPSHQVRTQTGDYMVTPRLL